MPGRSRAGQAKNRWTTSNRNVFCQREGVQNSIMSASLSEKFSNLSNGLVMPSEHSSAKPHLSRMHHCSLAGIVPRWAYADGCKLTAAASAVDGARRPWQAGSV